MRTRLARLLCALADRLDPDVRWELSPAGFFQSILSARAQATRLEREVDRLARERASS